MHNDDASSQAQLSTSITYYDSSITDRTMFESVAQHGHRARRDENRRPQAPAAPTTHGRKSTDMLIASTAKVAAALIRDHADDVEPSTSRGSAHDSPPTNPNTTRIHPPATTMSTTHTTTQRSSATRTRPAPSTASHKQQRRHQRHGHSATADAPRTESRCTHGSNHARPLNALRTCRAALPRRAPVHRLEFLVVRQHPQRLGRRGPDLQLISRARGGEAAGTREETDARASSRAVRACRVASPARRRGRSTRGWRGAASACSWT